MVRNQGYFVPEIAKSLSIASNLLYRSKDQQAQLSIGGGLAEAEETELQRLRKENKMLRMEKEVLKKARAWVAGKWLRSSALKVLRSLATKSWRY